MTIFSTLRGKLTAATCGTILVGVVGFLSDLQSIFTDQPTASVVIDEIRTKPVELSMSYQELSNAKLAKKYLNTEVEIQATYLGPWNLEQVYGIKFPENVITLNHRDSAYTSQSTPLGSSDLVIPDFALTVPVELSSEVLKIKSHSIVRVKGTVHAFKNSFGQDVVVLNATQVSPEG
ncbi:hypothetical protein [Pseudomonas sp. EL_65y_Pfl2_R95]|uniref:hypothetical protein n=1 Tax=Pseudomonas sp. EL_65y_Pfl2_R95 TaxID=3088698 RepID=UPI0030DD86F0